MVDEMDAQVAIRVHLDQMVEAARMPGEPREQAIENFAESIGRSAYTLNAWLAGKRPVPSKVVRELDLDCAIENTL